MKFLMFYPDLDFDPGLPELLKSYGETVIVSGLSEAKKMAEEVNGSDYDGIFLSLDKEDKSFISSFIKSLPRNVAENIGGDGLRLFLISGRTDLVYVLNFFKRDGIIVLTAPVEKRQLDAVFQ